MLIFRATSNLNIFVTPHQKVMCRLCRLKDFFFEMSCHISEQIKQLKTVALVQGSFLTYNQQANILWYVMGIFLISWKTKRQFRIQSSHTLPSYGHYLFHHNTFSNIFTNYMWRQWDDQLWSLHVLWAKCSSFSTNSHQRNDASLNI